MRRTSLTTEADLTPDRATFDRNESTAATAHEQIDVADLPSLRISQMNCDELVRVVRAAQLPFLNSDVDRRLAFRDRQTLVRLANLARRCCRNRLASRPCREEEGDAALVTPDRTATRDR